MLITEEELNLIPHCMSFSVPCICDSCQTTFYITKSDAKRGLKGTRKNKFCSFKCHHKSLFTGNMVNCINCDTQFYKKKNDIKRSSKHFCSSSCAATYNNSHKTHGTRRSKLELFIEKELPLIYHNLTFQFNKKDAINSELDIYIPNLKLAFELNGIFHYKPIYGESKLQAIQTNDKKKQKACLEKNIKLISIDVSNMKRFSNQEAKKYLSEIKNIIKEQLC
jgi:hypothetical protein